MEMNEISEVYVIFVLCAFLLLFTATTLLLMMMVATRAYRSFCREIWIWNWSHLFWIVSVCFGLPRNSRSYSFHHHHHHHRISVGMHVPVPCYLLLFYYYYWRFHWKWNLLRMRLDKNEYAHTLASAPHKHTHLNMWDYVTSERYVERAHIIYYCVRESGFGFNFDGVVHRKRK